MKSSEATIDLKHKVTCAISWLSISKLFSYTLTHHLKTLTKILIDYAPYPQDWHLALQVKYWSGNVSSIGFSISPLNLSFNT